MHIIESGNAAAAIGVKQARAQVVAAYPITPQTPLTEKLSEFIESGEMDAQYIPVESEHSSLAVCIAASTAGARTFTATSANGLLYMSEQLHWAAGARLPLVMCVVNRGVGAPWTIWNDHQDAMSQRDNGWIQIYVNDHQQIIDTVIKAFCLAERMSIPVMVCYDGYILSHTYMPFEVPDEVKVDAFLPPFKPNYILDPENPTNLNTVTMPDIRNDVRGEIAPGYMEIRHMLHMDMRSSIDELADIDRKYQEIFGRGGSPFVEGYQCDDADYVVVCMGSLAYQMRDVVDSLHKDGISMGVLGVHLYRPFPNEPIINALKKAKRIIVLEKALSYGYQGPLYSDIKSALYPFSERPLIANYILGLGGREIRTSVLYEELKKSCGASEEIWGDASKWIGLRM